MGPGRYVPEACSDPSNKETVPKWTLPKAGRADANNKPISKNQTYDTRSSFGRQNHSVNKTSGVTHFGTSGRDNKTGTFKDLMQGGTAVKLYHPTY